MLVVILLHLMQIMGVHNTYTGYYFSHGARINVQTFLVIDAYTPARSKIVRDMRDKLPCVSLDNQNELKCDIAQTLNLKNESSTSIPRRANILKQNAEARFIRLQTLLKLSL